MRGQFHTMKLQENYNVGAISHKEITGKLQCGGNFTQRNYRKITMWDNFTKELQENYGVGAILQKNNRKMTL